MIDIHCHLLPQIDDGSKDTESSIEQLRLMEDGGISKAYFTSHYFRGHYHYSRDEYDVKLLDFKHAAKTAGFGIEIESGFEVFLQPRIVEDINEKSLTMGSSKYVLIESELNGLPTDFYNNVFPLLRAGYYPILAHAERYVSMMSKPSRARDLSERNIYIQTNAGSLIGHYGEKVRKTAWTMVENGWTHFIASDDHTRLPYFAMFEAYKQVCERIDEHTAELLFSIHPRSIANEEKILYQYVQVHRKHHKRKKNWFVRLFG